MTFDGVDPVQLELLAVATNHAATDLRQSAAEIAGALDQAGDSSGVPGRLRALADLLEADAADQRRRRRLVIDDQGLMAMLVAGGGAAGYNGLTQQDVIDDLLHGYHDAWDGNHDQTMPFGQWFWAAKNLWGKVAWLSAGAGEVPSILDSKVGQWAIKIAPWLDSPIVADLSVGLGVVGGLYQGIKGTVGLVQDGNPIDAFHREGAKYVVKVAGTALGYSTAAFVVCPNPVTGGAVVVSGAVWLGAEAWEHAGQISQGVTTAAHAVDSAWNASVDAVGSAATTTVDAVGSALTTTTDVLSDVAGWL